MSSRKISGVRKNKSGKATAYAYRLSSLRPRSEKELKDRLFRKGFGRATVLEVIALLKEKRIIDDLKFANLWVESRMRANPKGVMLLRKELREKGIEGAIIEKVLSERGEVDEEGLAQELAAQKLGSMKGLPEEKVKRRLFGFLARRGFSFDTIGGVVRDCVKQGD